MAPQTNSVYLYYPWLAGFLTFFGVAVVCAAITAIVLCCAPPRRGFSIGAGIVAMVGAVSLCFMFAITAAFEALPLAACVILSFVANVVLGPFISVLFGSKYAVAFRKTDKDDASGDDPTKYGDREPRGVAEASAETLPPMDLEKPGEEEEAGCGGRLQEAIESSGWPALVIVYVILLLVMAVAHATLFGACLCNSPQEFTTWASRASQTPTCRRGEICHMYATVGSHCTDVVVIADFVARDQGSAPNGATMEWVSRDGGAHAYANTTAGRAEGVASYSTQRTRGRIVVDHPIREDWRVVAQFPALGLRCGANYSFRLRFTRDGAAVADRTEVFATLPGAGAPVRFIGGGDLHGGAKGHNMMRRLWEQQRDSHFVWVGGDVAYANNIRYCYRRWDSTLALLAEPRRPDGSRPLLMAAVGNHEAGGYLTADADTRAGRAAAYTHYPTYFPSAEVLNDFVVFPGPLAVAGANGSTALVRDPSHPVLPAVTAAGLPAGHVGATFATTPGLRGDATVTFYRALIGSTAWIVLDSDVMFRTEAQLGYINETLALWSQLRAAGQLTKLVAAYHCPGLPTVRALDNKQAVKVRRDFYPLLLRWNVSLVLEHHDHAYKRTHRIASVLPDGSGSTAAPDAGFLVTGDGALGVSKPSRDAKLQWFHQRGETRNAGFAVEQSPSGYFSFRVFDEAGVLFDSFRA